jgi:hypothetical protein
MKTTSQSSQFWQQVYQNFTKRADACKDLVDALSSNTGAKSVVELSLEACFRRDHTSLFKAIAAYQPEQASKSLAQLAAPYLPSPHQRPFWLLGVDTTPQSRLYAQTLKDRGYVYQPTALTSNKPVTIGHQYSAVVLLPERAVQRGSPWVVPLSVQRVSSADNKELVGALQINVLLDDKALPFHGQLCVEVGDSSYCKPMYLWVNRPKANLVTVVRVRGNRTFYRQAPRSDPTDSPGHPKWYGAPFSLQDPQTWGPADETASLTGTSCRGRVYQVEIKAWFDLLMRGKRKPVPIPMHRYPFMLVRICLYNEKGDRAYPRPLWLIVIGEQRRQLSLPDIHTAYNQRYDIEHFFRFGKQKLLMDDFQTPITAHEESWWSLTHLAYLQLWVARHEAENQPRPWERSLPATKTRTLSPSQVQRDFERIIRQFGTPALAPKRRGNSPGRRKGAVFARRPRLPVVYKGHT